MKALVLVANRMHLGYLGCYGNEWVQTPNVDRLAAEGVVFDQHYVDQPDAAGAERAWQTGCYQFPRATSEDESALQERANLFPLLAEAGIETVRISYETSAALAHALDQLASCKDWLLRVDLGILLPPWNTPEGFQYEDTTTEADEEEGELSTLGTEQEVPEAAYSEQRNRYASAVTHLDTVVAEVLHELEQRGLRNELLVVLTSDYGQQVGEEATRPGSRRLLHEELIHIPLILRLPGQAEAGRRIPTFTQSIDLLPTLFDAFTVPIPAVHGQSLLPLARGQRAEIRGYACAGLRKGDAVEGALRSTALAFLAAMFSDGSETSVEPELYLKPEDRWEVNNMSHHSPEWTERLKQTLGEFVEATRRPGPLEPPQLPDLAPESAAEEQDPITESEERGTAP